MSEQSKDEAAKETGIEIGSVVFDGNGQIVGLDEAFFDSVAGGLKNVDYNGDINREKCL